LGNAVNCAAAAAASTACTGAPVGTLISQDADRRSRNDRQN
jgi:hypothetical protein